MRATRTVDLGTKMESFLAWSGSKRWQYVWNRRQRGCLLPGLCRAESAYFWDGSIFLLNHLPTSWYGKDDTVKDQVGNAHIANVPGHPKPSHYYRLRQVRNSLQGWCRSRWSGLWLDGPWTPQNRSEVEPKPGWIIETNRYQQRYIQKNYCCII